MASRKEAPINFLTDPLEGRSTLRPAGVLLFGWAEGKHTCVDKHEAVCLENQHVFMPFAFDTFRGLAPEAIRFLDQVQKVVLSNSPKAKDTSFIFNRVGFTI